MNRLGVVPTDPRHACLRELQAVLECLLPLGPASGMQYKVVFHYMKNPLLDGLDPAGANVRRPTMMPPPCRVRGCLGAQRW